jgi:polyisoprenoid-binding protein YceI
MALPAGTHELGPATGDLLVHTTRDGVAARAGHDLVLEVRRWSARIVADDATGRSTLTATVDARSMGVRGGTGGVKPLTDRDMAEITKNIAQKVLRSDRHPEITFVSTSVQGSEGRLDVEGELTIAGTTRPARFAVALEDQDGTSVLRASVTLVQSAWGIRPFTALMGALKVADSIEISAEARLPSA